jgi:CRP-like cAMP-binding protein
MHGKSFQERFRSKNAPPKAAATKKWRRLGTFIPRAWELQLLKTTSVSTERLARELLYLHWRNEQDLFSKKGEPVIVSNAIAKAAGIAPRSKSRALTELQRLGLVRLDRNPKKAPRAFLLRVPALNKSWARSGP